MGWSRLRSTPPFPTFFDPGSQSTRGPAAHTVHPKNRPCGRGGGPWVARDVGWWLGSWMLGWAGSLMPSCGAPTFQRREGGDYDVKCALEDCGVLHKHKRSASGASMRLAFLMMVQRVTFAQVSSCREQWRPMFVWSSLHGCCGCVNPWFTPQKTPVMRQLHTADNWDRQDPDISAMRPVVAITK